MRFDLYEYADAASLFPFPSSSPSLFLVRSRRIRLVEFHYRTSTRLSRFSGTSQITEIKGALGSLEDTPASCFRALLVPAIVRSTALGIGLLESLVPIVPRLISNVRSARSGSRNQSALRNSTNARAEFARRAVSLARSSRAFSRRGIKEW